MANAAVPASAPAAPAAPPPAPASSVPFYARSVHPGDSGTPPRPPAVGAVLQALRRLGKPVEMVVLEDGVHALERPWDRRVSLQSNVDWFTFWLKGEEDRDPAKAEQYARWRALRKLHEQQQITADTGAAEPGSR